MEELTVGKVIRKAMEGGAKLQMAHNAAEKLSSKAREQYEKMMSKLR